MQATRGNIVIIRKKVSIDIKIWARMPNFSDQRRDVTANRSNEWMKKEGRKEGNKNCLFHSLSARLAGVKRANYRATDSKLRNRKDGNNNFVESCNEMAEGIQSWQ